MERDRVAAGVSPDASPTRFRFYSRSLPVPASGLGPHGALRPLPGAGARRAPSRVGGGPGGRRERTLGTVAAPQPGLGRGVGAALSREARGHPAGPAESAGSSRASSGPRPESLAPREAGASSVRFPVFLSRPFRISPSPLRTPSLVIHRGNRAKEAVGQWPRHTTEGR